MVKPQLVIQEVGVHNADLQASSARIMSGGSYKKQRVIMAIPAISPIPPKVYLSHCSLIFPPNQPSLRMLAMGMEVGDAYSSAVENILAHPELSQWEFFLTIEADNIPPCDGIIKLIERMENNPQLAAISGLYWTKGHGGVTQIWGDINDPLPNYRPQLPPPPGQIKECYGLGMGFTLFRLRMLKDKRLRRPWFKTVAGREGVGTQDLYFFSDARKYGYRFAVDANVLVGHYDYEGKFGPPDTVW